MERSLADELGALLALEVDELTVSAVVEHMARLEQARARFEAAALEALATFERSGAWRLDAAYNVTNWLTAQTGTTRADARRRARLAHHLQDMPATAAALAAGEITVEHARILSWCVANPRTAPMFVFAERGLVDQARCCPADQLVWIIRQWIELTDQDGPEPRDPDPDTLSVNRVGDRVKLDGDLGLDTGLPLLAALAERTDQLLRRDRTVAEANPEDPLAHRTLGNRRAEALVELVMAGSGDTANSQRREPLFNVHVDDLTLLRRRITAESIRELDDGSVLPLDTLALWGCGAFYDRVLRDADNEILNLGRTERYATPALRRALTIRDRGCAVPGCDRPPEHCDAHHIVFWENQGGTDLDNLVLQCRHHHRMIHAGHLTIDMDDGRPRFRDRHGQELTTGRRRRQPQAQAAQDQAA